MAFGGKVIEMKYVLINNVYCIRVNCLRWLSWLRHSAKYLKVAGLIPDDIIGIFH